MMGPAKLLLLVAAAPRVHGCENVTSFLCDTFGLFCEANPLTTLLQTAVNELLSSTIKPVRANSARPAPASITHLSFLPAGD